MKTSFAAALICVSMGSPTLAREFDAETGLIHMRARDYDPETGRFLQEDPAPPFFIPGAKARPADVNLYVYARNSPLKYIDPLGLRPLTPRERTLLGPYIPEVDLENADVHEEGVPWYVPKRYIGITRGNDIYFRPGIYDPLTPEGISLLGHELVHVGQYRKGANWRSFMWSYRRGYGRSKYEREASAIEDEILAGLPRPLPPLEPAPLNCEPVP